MKKFKITVENIYKKIEKNNNKKTWGFDGDS